MDNILYLSFKATLDFDFYSVCISVSEKEMYFE